MKILLTLPILISAHVYAGGMSYEPPTFMVVSEQDYKRARSCAALVKGHGILDTCAPFKRLCDYFKVTFYDPDHGRILSEVYQNKYRALLKRQLQARVAWFNKLQQTFWWSIDEVCPYVISDQAESPYSELHD